MTPESEILNNAGTETILKGENLLPQIKEMFSAAAISTLDIDRIVVSAGPGSFTGIRIGIATALGLAKALNVTVNVVSALKSMTVGAKSHDLVLCALPMGRGAICIQHFQNIRDDFEELDGPQTMPEKSFEELLQKKDRSIVLMHGSLYSQFAGYDNIVDTGFNLASKLAEFSIQHPEENIKPIFVAKSF